MPPTLTLDENGGLDIDSIYDPLPTQHELHTSAAKYLLGIGGGGSGKSFFLLGETIYIASEFPGANILLLRRNFRELEKGLILDFRNTVPRELYRYNDSKHIATWFNDSKIFFGHLQNNSEKDLAQYLSAAFVFIGVDELGQFSYNAWSYLSFRNRVNSGCQANQLGNMPFCRMGGATNPLGPGYGWIKQTWIDRKPVSQLGETTRGKDGKHYQEVKGHTICVYDPADYHYVHSTVLQNPFQMEKDPDYIDKLQKLPPALRSKALEGDVNQVAGAYFTNFLYERNVRSLPRDREDIQFQDWQPVWIGFDWGLAHHTAIYWNQRAMVRDIDGALKMRVLTHREMVVNEDDYQIWRQNSKNEDLNYKQYLCREIYRRTPEEERKRLKYIFLSPDRFKHTEDTAHTVASDLSEILRDLGLPRCSEANDAREDGAVLMYNLIDSGEWIILDNCQILISSIETRVRNETKLEDVLKTEDDLDDAYDGSRYGLLSMLRERGKPADVKLAEKLATIPDHTSRLIYAYSHRLKEQSRNKAFQPKIALGPKRK